MAGAYLARLVPGQAGSDGSAKKTGPFETMRFILAIFAIWVAIVIFPEQPRASGVIEEKVWMSRTCPGSHWYLAESDESSITVHCDPEEPGDGN